MILDGEALIVQLLFAQLTVVMVTVLVVESVFVTLDGKVVIV